VSLSEIGSEVKVRRCSKCHHPLGVTNKGDMCWGAQACNDRATKKVASIYTPPIKREVGPGEESAFRSTLAKRLFNNRLTFEHVLDALCDHFDYSSSRRAVMLTDMGNSDYRHARYTLLYLLTEDLGTTQERAAGFVGCAPRTATTARQHVLQNKTLYEHDIKCVRQLYPPETRVQF